MVPDLFHNINNSFFSSSSFHLHICDRSEAVAVHTEGLQWVQEQNFTELKWWFCNEERAN